MPSSPHILSGAKSAGNKLTHLFWSQGWKQKRTIKSFHISFVVEPKGGWLSHSFRNTRKQRSQDCDSERYFLCPRAGRNIRNFSFLKAFVSLSAICCSVKINLNSIDWSSIFFSLVTSLNVDMLATGIRFRIYSKCNCFFVITVNDHCTEGKICILRQDKMAGVRSNQTLYVRKY